MKIHTIYGIVVTAFPMIYDPACNIYISRQYNLLGLEGAFDLWIKANIMENLGEQKLYFIDISYYIHRRQTVLELDHLHHGHGTLAGVHRVARAQVPRTGEAPHPGHSAQEDQTASNFCIRVEEHWIKEQSISRPGTAKIWTSEKIPHEAKISTFLLQRPRIQDEFSIHHKHPSQRQRQH